MKGRNADLTSFDSSAIFRLVQQEYAQMRKKRAKDEPIIDEDDGAVTDRLDYKAQVLDIVKALPPAGFEQLCQRLLREAGFQQATISGRSGDGGIDGVGVLQINPFVSFTVLFQCKRYQAAVTPSQVWDFRGAMMGRADKRIVVTTGTSPQRRRRKPDATACRRSNWWQARIW